MIMTLPFRMIRTVSLDAVHASKMTVQVLFVILSYCGAPALAIGGAFLSQPWRVDFNPRIDSLDLDDLLFDYPGLSGVMAALYFAAIVALGPIALRTALPPDFPLALLASSQVWAIGLMFGFLLVTVFCLLVAGAIQYFGRLYGRCRLAPTPEH